MDCAHITLGRNPNKSATSPFEEFFHVLCIENLIIKKSKIETDKLEFPHLVPLSCSED